MLTPPQLSSTLFSRLVESANIFARQKREKGASDEQEVESYLQPETTEEALRQEQEQQAHL